jgi:hypothetical protein
MNLQSTAALALVAAALVVAPALAPVAAVAQMNSAPAPAATPKLAKTTGIIKTVVAGVATLESGERVYFNDATVFVPRKPNMTDTITIYGTRGADGVLQAQKVVIGKGK